MQDTGPAYRPTEHVVMTEVEREAVLLHMGTGAYYGLDEVGTEVWRLLEEGTPTEGIVGSLRERYDVDESRLRADIEELIADLRAAKLIEAP